MSKNIKRKMRKEVRQNKRDEEDNGEDTKVKKSNT
jgi:hypothetical protein